MLTYYCPKCWANLEAGASRCPACGFKLGAWDRLSYEDKLLRTLEHPIPEKRMEAIRILGEMQSQKALPGFALLLSNETEDYYTQAAVVHALANVSSPQALALLRKAAGHLSPLIRKEVEKTLRARARIP